MLISFFCSLTWLIFAVVVSNCKSSSMERIRLLLLLFTVSSSPIKCSFALVIIEFAAAKPKTTQSNKELPPKRFSPCTPPMISPAAYKLLIVSFFLFNTAPFGFTINPPIV